MSMVGAAGAILAGVVLGWIGYGGLALVVGILVVAVVALAPWGRDRRAEAPADAVAGPEEPAPRP